MGEVRSRIVGTVVAVATGFVLLAGCGSADPAQLTGIGPGGDGAGGGGTGVPIPGSTDGTPAPGTTGGGGTGGTGGGGTGDGTGPKPCTMITAQDAGQALGTTANNTTDSDEECLYESGDNAVMLSVRAEAYDEATVSEISQLGSAVKKVDGIGDAAYQISLGPETQFHVWIHGKYVVVVVTKEAGETDAPARTLLDKVLTKV